MAESTCAAQIILQYMPQQDAIRGPEDVWSGLSSAAERRKAQNRLNQRAWRKRKALQRSKLRIAQHATIDENSFSEQRSSPEQKLAPKKTSSCGSSGSSEGTSSLVVRATNRESPGSQSHVVRWQEVDLLDVFDAAAGHSPIKHCERARMAAACAQGNLDGDAVVNWLQKWAQNTSTMGSPRSDKFLVLVKINVFRALISNSLTLGIPSDVIMDDDATSAFCPPAVDVSGILALPRALRPTDLQTQVPHHPWIDCLPVPQMRQNLIRARDTFDVMDLCGDLVGLFSPGTGRTGIVVWGEPWDGAGWEVTEEFLRRWGWTIKGCWDLFESTNRCRAARGEMALCFDRHTI